MSYIGAHSFLSNQSNSQVIIEVGGLLGAPFLRLDAEKQELSAGLRGFLPARQPVLDAVPTFTLPV
jgi:hypothetical protein